VPNLVRRINNALVRADQIQHHAGQDDVEWFAPVVADAEAGFGGPLNTFELIKSMIEGGRGRGPFGRPALVAEKMRPHGRQGVGVRGEFVPKLIAARPGG